jgi:hypothetical protein
MGQRKEYTYLNHSFPAVGNYALDYTVLGTSDEGFTLPTFTAIPDIEITAVNARNTVTILAGTKTVSGVTLQHGSGPALPPFTFNFKIIAREAVVDGLTDFYGVISEAADLAGVDQAALTETIQTQINSWIEARLYNGNTFTSHVGEVEWHDIEETGENELICLKRPIISVSELIDDARGDSPVTINSGAYVLNRAGGSGIIQLESKNVTGTDVITSFTKGVSAVKVTYTWGFASVPTKVEELATLMAAKFLEVDAQQEAADGLKSVQAGDYKEAYDMTFLNVRTKYDKEINILVDELRKKYYTYA